MLSNVKYIAIAIWPAQIDTMASDYTTGQRKCLQLANGRHKVTKNSHNSHGIPL